VTPRVVVALGRSEWEARFIAQLAHPVSPVRLVRRCVDGDDIRAALDGGGCDAVVVSDHIRGVGVELVTVAVTRGIRVIALSDDVARWAALDVRDVLRVSDVEPSACLTALCALLVHSVPSSTPKVRGTGVMVAGFGSATGRTSVVRELAVALSRADGSAGVLAVDADVYQPSLSQQMVLGPREFTLLQACRSAESGENLATLLRAATANPVERVWVLPGLARATRWSDLRPAALQAVWQAALGQFTLVVADAGPVLEPNAGPRGAAAYSMLAACDSVVLCSRADAIGIARLVRGYAECDDLLASKHLTVVVVGAEGRREQREVEQAVLRLTGLPSVLFLPHRPEVYRRTERDGGTAAVRDRDTARAVALLAGTVLPPKVVTPRPISTQAIEDYLRPRAA
jgi:MinD-like ATPase involved in chromosome partitioning or flagellar assembly